MLLKHFSTLSLLALSGGLFAAAACESNPDTGDKNDESMGGAGTSTGGGLGLGGNLLGSGGDGNGGDTCGGTSVEAEPKAANLLFVIDTSGSMEDTPSGFTKSKWDTVVDTMNSTVPELNDQISVGAKFFPSGNAAAGATECTLDSGVDVGVDAGDTGRTALLDALKAETTGGATPTGAALSEALTYFTTGAGKDLEGDKYVLLATDGGPNCNDMAADCTCDGNPSGDSACGDYSKCTTNIDKESAPCDTSGSNGSCCTGSQRHLCLDDAGTLAEVKALADAGIKTIVVGMPGSEAYTDVLDALAEEGGLAADTSSPKYYQAADPAALAGALNAVTANLITSCELELTSNPDSLDKVNVFLDGEVVPKADTDSWQFKDGATTADGFPIIELTGKVCTEVETSGVASIDVKFGCKTVVK